MRVVDGTGQVVQPILLPSYHAQENSHFTRGYVQAVITTGT